MCAAAGEGSKGGIGHDAYLVIDVGSEEENPVLGKAGIDVHLALADRDHGHGD